MPVRSLNSSVFKWPNRRQVDQAVRDWVKAVTISRPEILRIGYFGSYARGDWGVGSDLDLVAIIDHSAEPFERRSLHWNLNELPVPADILVYTLDEWERLQNEDGLFARTIKRDTIWVYEFKDQLSGA